MNPCFVFLIVIATLTMAERGEFCSAYTIIPTYTPHSSLLTAAALHRLSLSFLFPVTLQFLWRNCQRVNLYADTEMNFIHIGEDLRCASGGSVLYSFVIYS